MDTLFLRGGSMRKTISILIVCILVIALAGGAVFAAQSKYKGFPVVNLMLNGQLVKPPSPAIVIDGTTYVPLRFVSESMGISVGWDQKTQTVIIGKRALSAQKTINLSQTKDNVTVTITSVTANNQGTILKVKVTNNSPEDVTFAASIAQLVAGSTQFDNPLEYDLTFINDLKPGVTKEGNIKFPALPSGTKSFKVYFKAWNAKNILIQREYIFDINL